MMERDKFLTEAMGLKIHSDNDDYPPDEPRLIAPLNFFRWNNFGRLWEWAQQQEWWKELIGRIGEYGQYDGFRMSWINPDLFANVLYAFLKDRNE